MPNTPDAPCSPDLGLMLGGIDIYLLDQVMRGRIRPGARIFDAGCGAGRNLTWFLRAGHEVAGVDPDPRSIEKVRRLATELAPSVDLENFRNETIESCSFPDEWADLVVSSAVLHFARNETEFRAMLYGSWRLLRPSGLLFCRLGSTIGMSEERFERIESRRFRVPDGTERFLVDEEALMSLTTELGGELVDPLKTTVVQNLRCMTTWVLRKNR
ncbi:MAG: class I SAM-dependent methyltransferase [Thermoanaerobaculia bacterium]|nr:class I SAM-dependent methyltransferase [Thermoanaerobaculia bacterium]